MNEALGRYRRLRLSRMSAGGPLCKVGEHQLDLGRYDNSPLKERNEKVMEHAIEIVIDVFSVLPKR